VARCRSSEKGGKIFRTKAHGESDDELELEIEGKGNLRGEGPGGMSYYRWVETGCTNHKKKKRSRITLDLYGAARKTQGKGVSEKGGGTKWWRVWGRMVKKARKKEKGGGGSTLVKIPWGRKIETQVHRMMGRRFSSKRYRNQDESSTGEGCNGERGFSPRIKLP